MAMEATKRLLKMYQNAAINLRRVADEMETLDIPNKEAMVGTSRAKALIYETVASELAMALLEDKVNINNSTNGD